MSDHSHRFRRRALAAIASAATAMTLLAACGGHAEPARSSATSLAGGTSLGSESLAPQSESAQTGADDTASVSATPSSAAGTDPTSEPSAQLPSYPVTITADNGEVTLSAQPTHIVSLSPTATEILYAIGAGSQVIAVDLQSNYPADLPEQRFDAYQLSVEAVSAVDPDVVITSYVSDAQLAQFAKLDIPVVWHNAPADIDGTYRQITDLGALTGHVAEAADLVSGLRDSIATITSAAQRFDPPATYYYELDDTYYSVTSDTLMGSILGMLGLKSIADSAQGAAAAGGYPQLSPEFIVAANPDYVFLADAGWADVSPQQLAARPGWSALSAVADGRVVELDGDIASRWGPRVVDLLRSIADAIAAHPATR